MESKHLIKLQVIANAVVISTGVKRNGEIFVISNKIQRFLGIARNDDMSIIITYKSK